MLISLFRETYMSQFYVLEIGSINQHEYAYYELYGEPHYSDSHSCPECGRHLGVSRWEPPYDLKLKQSQKIGDFIDGYGGCDFIASNKFVKLAKEFDIKGIERKFAIHIVRTDTDRRIGEHERPVLYGIDLVYSKTQVLYNAMEVVWSKKPSDDYCIVCGPGGGGKSGVWKSIEKVVIDEATWSGEDIFHPINFSENIIISSKTANLIRDYTLTNVSVIPCDEFRL